MGEILSIFIRKFRISVNSKLDNGKGVYALKIKHQTSKSLKIILKIPKNG